MGGAGGGDGDLVTWGPPAHQRCPRHQSSAQPSANKGRHRALAPTQKIPHQPPPWGDNKGSPSSGGGRDGCCHFGDGVLCGGGIYGCWCGDPPMLWGWGCCMGTCPSPRVSVSPFEGGVIRLNCAPPPCASVTPLEGGLHGKPPAPPGVAGMGGGRSHTAHRPLPPSPPLPSHWR